MRFFVMFFGFCLWFSGAEASQSTGFGDLSKFVKTWAELEPEYPVGIEDFLKSLERIEREVGESEKSLRPAKRKKPRDGSVTPALSDGKFAKLSQKWRRGVPQVLKSGACEKYGRIVRELTGNDRQEYNFLMAHMLVESNCVPDVIVNGDHGLMMVRADTCKEVGIVGDLLDPRTNITCAFRYRKKLCRAHRKCDPALQAGSYNMGPTGVERVSDLRATEYVRKFHYALELWIGLRSKIPETS